MEQTKRTAYLDAIRVLAGLFVVYNHVAGQSMRLFSGVGGAVALCFLYISKAAIPLFLMVTGALLLQREEPYAKTLRRIGRIVLVLALVTLLYYGADCLENRAPFVLADYLERLYYYEASNSLWYLYAYLGLLVMLPILQRMAAALGAREYLYAACWTLLFTGALPILEFASPLFTPDSSFTLPVFSGMVGLPLLGRAMSGETRPSRVHIGAAVLLPLGAVAAATALTMRSNAWFSIFDNAFLLPAMLTAAGIFYLARRYELRRGVSERARQAVTHVGKLVFGAYLLADLAIARLQCLREALEPLLTVNGAGVAYTVLVYAVCLLAAEGLTRIPGLRRLL